MPDFTGGQFPSLDGDAEAEVAQRTEPDTEGSWFRHVFTVHNRAHTVGLPADHDVHQRNFVAVLQRALQQGLHPKALPELESEEPHPWDPSHTNLTYRVQVVPAVADLDPTTTVTPSVVGPGVGAGGVTHADPLTVQTPETPSPEAAGGRTPGSGSGQTETVSETGGEATEG
jgi:hypothetical protein